MRCNSAAVKLFVRRAAVCGVLLVALPRPARSQTWASTDVGTVGLAGSATADGTAWTVRGSGADIWGTNDGFQFLHRVSNRTGFIVVRVNELEAAHPFAKVGLMIRASLSANAAAAVLDVKPDGGVEFMTRASAGASMQYVDGTSSSLPVWLRLGWTGSDVTAWTSTDGTHWTTLCSTSLALPATPEAGVAVTSHDETQLATAQVDNLSVGVQEITWTSAAIGATSQPGSADEENGVWRITGAGSDIWGGSDSFQYLYRGVAADNLHLVARVDDLRNTNPFAKAGLMLRDGLGADAAAVIVDVTPGGQVEFMTRSQAGGEMAYIAGTTVTFPAWLQLSWTGDNASTADVVASVSQNGATWTDVGPGVPFSHNREYDAGVAVTSHDPSQTTTAHVDALSLLPIGWRSDDIGATSGRGNAVMDIQPADVIFTVEGAGTDVWGEADGFQFVHLPAIASAPFTLTYRVASLRAAHAFAKAGLMFRDGLSAGAPSVMLDATPGGGVEFMARLCGGCATTYLGGANIVFPAFLSLSRDGSTFTARVFTADPADGTTVGSVEVPMADPDPGFAVTSHDPSQTITAIFDQPAR